MKSILFYANDDDAVESRLTAALDLVRAFDGHLTCLQATPYDSFILSDPFGGLYALPNIIEQLRAAETAHRAKLEERLGREGVSWDWLRYDGAPAQLLVDRSRLADVIVISLRAEDGRTDGAPLSLAADVAIHARTPVVAVPSQRDRLDCDGIAIVAWNGSPESSHALRLALPLLKRASAVHIVTASDDYTDFPATDASEYLSRHGVCSDLHTWSREGRTVAETLLDAAAVLNGSYIVAGAYGHSRLRESVLGGVTRDLLHAATVPLVLAH